MKHLMTALLASLTSVALLACGAPSAPAGPALSGPQPAQPSTLEDETPPLRNLILLIGDGMGPGQLGYLLDYAEYAANPVWGDRTTAMGRMAEEGSVGLSRTSPADAIVVDSACSATQLATGKPALGETLALDVDGNPVDTVLLAAARSGRSTGLVTDTRITHATPAAFAAHAAHRSMENEIARQYLAFGVDVLLSGGVRNFVPDSVHNDESITGGVFPVTGRRDDGRNLLHEAQDAGYSVVFDRNALLEHTTGPLLGLFAESSMVDAITCLQTRNDPDRTYPTLTEMSVAALEILDQNPAGFFVMIEGGQIDWAAHNNDAGHLLHEMIRFDEAIRAVLEWAEGRDDTLVVVTADHETGGFGFTYSGIDLPEPREVPGLGFAECSYQPDFNFGAHSLLDRLYGQSMTYRDILSATLAAPEDERAQTLHDLVNTHTAFPIALEDAERIMRTVPNRRRVEGHGYLGLESMPDMCDDTHPFYPYYMDGHMGLLAATQARQNHVVWNTGTHTHVPVPVLAWGHSAWARRFDGIHHHVGLGQIFFDVLGLEPGDAAIPE